MMLGQYLMLGGASNGARLANVSDLAFWVDASLSTLTIATGVSQETDLSGNARHLLQSVGSKQPTLVTNVLNGLSALRYDGVNDFMVASFSLAAPITRFVVGRWRSSFAAQSSMYDGSVANNGRIYRASNTETHFNAGAEIVDSTDDNRTFRTYTVSAHGAGSTLWVDRVSIGTATLSPTQCAPTHGAIGGGGSDWGDVDIVCDAIFARTLSTAERTAVWDYLSHRTGLP